MKNPNRHPYRLYRYVFRELFPPLLIGVGFFTFIFILPPLKDLVRLTLEKGTPIAVTLELFFLTLPFTVSFTVPMGVLFSTIFATARLSGDSEIIAMRGAGISLFSLLWPTLAFGVLMMSITFLFSNFVSPYTNERYKALYVKTIYANPSILIEDRTFADIPNTTKKIASLSVDKKDSLMNSVYLYEYNEEKSEIRITFAKKGRWLNNVVNSQVTTLELFNGETLHMNTKNFLEIQKIEFENILINIVNDIREVKKRNKSIQEKTLVELSNEITKLKLSMQEIRPILYIEYHKRFSLPLACIVFSAFSLPLGISVQRSGKGASFGIAIVVIFFYYFLLVTMETLGKRGLFDAAWSIYIPNVVFSIAALYLYVTRLTK